MLLLCSAQNPLKTNRTIPRSWCLFQSIQWLLQFTNLFLYVLPHLILPCRSFLVKKSYFYIKLSILHVLLCSKYQHCPYWIATNEENLLIINISLLMSKAFLTQTSFILMDIFMWTIYISSWKPIWIWWAFSLQEDFLDSDSCRFRYHWARELLALHRLLSCNCRHPWKTLLLYTKIHQI